MIQQLMFLQSALADKPLQPILKNVSLNKGTLQTGNGKVTAIAVIDELATHTMAIDGDRFLKAMLMSEGEASITGEQRITVKHGSFKVKLQATAIDEYPATDFPEPFDVTPVENLLAAFRTLYPFVGEAGRTALWSCGIQLTGTHAYATNNIVLIKHELEVELPETVIIPIHTIEALLKIGEEPTGIWTDGKQVWFCFPDDRWLHSRVVDAKWPDIDAIIGTTEKELPIELHNDIKKMTPFCEDSATQTIILADNKITTREGETTASIEGYTLGEASFRARPLIAVLKIATHADFTAKQVPFKGESFTGVMVGLK